MKPIKIFSILLMLCLGIATAATAQPAAVKRLQTPPLLSPPSMQKVPFSPRLMVFSSQTMAFVLAHGNLLWGL